MEEEGERNKKEGEEEKKWINGGEEWKNKATVSLPLRGGVEKPRCAYL